MPRAVPANGGGGPNLMQPAAQSVEHGRRMSHIPWFPHAQRMVIGIAQHGVRHDDEVVVRVWNAARLSLADGQHLVVDGSGRRGFVNVVEPLVVQIREHRLKECVAAGRVGGQPHVHNRMNAPRALEIVIPCVGDIEESRWPPEV